MAELLNTGITTTEADGLTQAYSLDFIAGETKGEIEAATRSAKTAIWAGFWWGAAIGTLVGAVLAAFMARGTFMVIPAFGLVIPGPLGGALCGAVGGLMTGGVIGVLAALSMHEPGAGS